MRLLITGGAGFIGSNHIHHLFHTRAGAEAPCCPDTVHYDVKGDLLDLEICNVDALSYAGNLDNLNGVNDQKGYSFVHADITDVDAVEHAFKSFQPEQVIHFAAESHVDRSIEAGEVFTRTNVVGTQVLLDAARRHDADRFVHISTDEVYGSIDQGSFTEDSPLNPSSPYSASKAASDLLALAHHKTYGLDVVVTRCTNNYGPRQHAEKFIPTIIRKARAGEPIPIYGDGKQVRDWLYVKDHCGAVELARTAGDEGSVYNIASGAELENLALSQAVLARLARPMALVRHVRDRPAHDVRYSMVSDHMAGLGWRPKVSFETGLDYLIGPLTGS